MRIGPGAIARFPVSAPGALFYVGDCHAVQGDGEIVGNGIETSFEIEFTVRILKARKIGWPRGETSNSIFTVGNARPLDQALQHATSEMLEWLREEFGLEPIAVIVKCLFRDFVFSHRFLGVDLAKRLTGFALGGSYNLSLECLVVHFLF